MTTTDNSDKSVREAERNVEEARAELRGSIDALEERLTPGALFEDAFAYFQGSGRKYVGSITDEVRANPLPAVLIGVGLVWMAIDSGRRAQRAAGRPSSAAPIPPTRQPDPYEREAAYHAARADRAADSVPSPAGSTPAPVTSTPPETPEDGAITNREKPPLAAPTVVGTKTADTDSDVRPE
jgi:hypothetical protein